VLHKAKEIVKNTFERGGKEADSTGALDEHFEADGVAEASGLGAMRDGEKEERIDVKTMDVEAGMATSTGV